MQGASGGVVFQPSGLERGQRYTVWSYAPRIEPKELAALPAEYPDGLAPFLEVVPDVAFPAFGTAARHRAVSALFDERAGDGLLAAYEPVYAQTRRARRSRRESVPGGGHARELVSSAGRLRLRRAARNSHWAQAPPLVDFVLRTREGYCQHYAGAMALMLRLIGIPARVAAGFTSGSLRREPGRVDRHRSQRAHLGRGVVPGVRLARVRPYRRARPAGGRVRPVLGRLRGERPERPRRGAGRPLAAPARAAAPGGPGRRRAGGHRRGRRRRGGELRPAVGSDWR